MYIVFQYNADAAVAADARCGLPLSLNRSFKGYTRSLTKDQICFDSMWVFRNFCKIWDVSSVTLVSSRRYGYGISQMKKKLI